MKTTIRIIISYDEIEIDTVDDANKVANILLNEVTQRLGQFRGKTIEIDLANYSQKTQKRG